MGSPILFWKVQFKLQPFWIINSRSIWPTLQVLNIVCVHVDHPSIEQQWEIVSEGKVRMQVKVSDNKTELNSIVPQPVSQSGRQFCSTFFVVASHHSRPHHRNSFPPSSMRPVTSSLAFLIIPLISFKLPITGAR